MTKAKAVVYIPLDEPDEERHAREGLSYLHRRGYRFYAVLRRLDIAISLVEERRVNIIRFPPSSDPQRKARLVGDEGQTRDLTDCFSAKAKSRNRLHLWPGSRGSRSVNAAAIANEDATVQLPAPGQLQRVVLHDWPAGAETPGERRRRLNAYLDDAARRLRRGRGEDPAPIIRVIDGRAD